MRIEWSTRAAKDLHKLSDRYRAKVVKALDRYVETDHGDVKKLKGVNPPEYRLRVGTYRVRFMLAEDTLLVLGVQPRGDAYD